MTKSFVSNLVDRINAGYPGIIVQTTDWLRVESDVIQASKQLKCGYKRWTITSGWSKDPTKAGTPTNPSQALKDILTDKDFKEGIYLMHVFPELFRAPEIRQAIREALLLAKPLGRTVIMVGMFNLPEDLDKDFGVLDYEYPSREELTSLAEDLCKQATTKNALKKENLGDVVNAALGLTIPEAENAIALSLSTKGELDVGVILDEKKLIVKKSGILECYDTVDDINSVGGLDNLKQFLAERKRGFSEEAVTYGLTPPKGILLVGIPGCGKSLVAKCIANYWKLPLIRLDMGRVFGGLVGQSESQLRTALKIAEAVAPCILFIDEIEKGAAGLGGASSDGGTTQRVLGTLLTWMQDRKKPVFIMATANNVRSLPPEFLRKGRFDEIFGIDVPNKRERAEIATVHLTKRKRQKLATSANLKRIVQISDGYTGAEIEEAVNNAMYRAFNDNRDVDIDDIEEAISNTKPLSVTMKDEIIEIRKWLADRARPASKPEDEDELPKRIRAISQR